MANQLCPICEKGNLHACTEQIDVKYRGQTGAIPSQYSVCDACGSEQAGAADARFNKRAMVGFTLKCHITREEYLEIDNSSEEKHEYYQGSVTVMKRGSFNHSVIGTNVATTLQNLLSESTCRAMNSDMRISTPTGLDTYPDVSVFCGEPELSDDNCTLLNPSLIIEVLSPDTGSYDRGEKFLHYRSIPSLQDYLLIDSESILIEHYQRQKNHEWLLREHRGKGALIHLKSVDKKLAATRFYEQVQL